jgi:hypothetical protein
MKYFFILLLLPIKLFAQDISGVWIGYLYNDTTKQNIHYELSVSEFKGKPTGYSHTTFVIDSIENVGVKSVNIKEKNGHFYIVDDKLIFNNYPEPPAKGVKQFSFLSLSESNHAQILSGIWRTNATREYKPLTGSIYLEKRKIPEETLIVTKLAQLNLLDKLSYLTPSEASKIFALNNKPVSPAKIPSLTAQTSEPKDAAIKVREEIKPVKQPVTKPIEQEKAVAIVEKKIEKPAIATSPAPKPPVPVLEKKQPIAATVAEAKPDIKSPPTPPPKAVVTEQKKIEKPPVAQQPKTAVVQPKQEEKKIERPLIVQQPKQEEKKIVVKETPAPTQEKNQITVAPKAPPEPERKPTGPPAATEIAKRSIETIRTVEIARDSLVFSLYDNGAFDGDTVSVLLNGQVIMPRVGLLERATNKTIYLTPDMGDSISVIMYAENLGSIPPNTGLLVIREGEKIYEIRFSGDLNKNSKIILVRKKEN